MFKCKIKIILLAFKTFKIIIILRVNINLNKEKVNGKRV